MYLYFIINCKNRINYCRHSEESDKKCEYKYDGNMYQGHDMAPWSSSRYVHDQVKYSQLHVR